MKFFKYHALGNDYLVLNPKDSPNPLTKNEIIKICHRNYGLGSDGILYGPMSCENADFELKIFNPDGSEAEKSGNGLRIFARYLYDNKYVTNEPFTIKTLGGNVGISIKDPINSISVDMGKMRFENSVKLQIEGNVFNCNIANIGNPHCVILMENVSSSDICKYGPFIENHKYFPNRTNIQFLKIIDRNNIQIEIWERGAGYTLASGSSSSAAAAVAHKLGYCDNLITVKMPGGNLEIEIKDNYDIKMVGSTTRVGDYLMDKEIFS